jgi:hypothetical protein
MRIADRLARLEQQEGGMRRMSPAEIDAAAAQFECALADGGMLKFEHSPLAAWRSSVETARPAWLQRIYANMAPEDFLL